MQEFFKKKFTNLRFDRVPGGGGGGSAFWGIGISKKGLSKAIRIRISHSSMAFHIVKR